MNPTFQDKISGEDKISRRSAESVNSGSIETTHIGHALHQLGRQLVLAGRLNEALDSLTLSADLTTADNQQAECRFDLANAYYAGGRMEEAISEYRRALRLHPGLAPAWYNLGVALMQTASPKEEAPWKDAEHAYRRALRFHPQYAEAHNNLGILLQAQRRVKEAIHHYRCAAALDANFHEPRFNLGSLLHDEGKLDEARRVFESLLEDAPNHVDARNNLANVLSALGHFDRARGHYEHALTVQPCHPLTSWNLGLNQLRTGDWEPGWRNYEWRLRQVGSTPPRSPMPLWDGGAPLDGARILLTAEQGLGDILQFVRFTQCLQVLGGRIWLECHGPLESLLSRTPGIEGVTVIGNPLPDHDCWLPLLSLPGVLQTTLQSLPNEVPYLAPHEGRAEYWRERLSNWTGIRAGLAWSGNPGFRVNHKRSFGEHDLRKFLQHTRRISEGAPLHLFSLQKGIATPNLGGLIPLDDDPSSMEDLAGVMMNLDLIVSVDTSVAHLAGALGRPVWTMLGYHADWRWMTPDRNDSPWYPSMRLFRQSKAGDWSGVLSDVKSELHSYCARVAAANANT